jgi:hypothetical protein
MVHEARSVQRIRIIVIANGRALDIENIYKFVDVFGI